MDALQAFVDKLSGFVWGPYCIVPLLVGAGCYFMIGLRFMPL